MQLVTNELTHFLVFRIRQATGFSYYRHLFPYLVLPTESSVAPLRMKKVVFLLNFSFYISIILNFSTRVKIYFWLGCK